MENSLLPFLAAVAFGSYVQAVTGFALGMFVLGGVVVLNLNSIGVAATATALNIMTVATGLVVALPRLREAHWRVIAITTIGLIPAMVGGVFALNYLNAQAQTLLRLLLGLLIVAGGLVLVWQQKLRLNLSSTKSFIAMGAVGGILGGLFGVPGPPLVYQLYRQPLSILTIRVTLLSLFSILAIGRLVVVGLQGHIGLGVLEMGAWSVPVVMGAAWLGNRFPPRLADSVMRRCVFVLLMLVGSFIVFYSVLAYPATVS